jgi:hypothetical protein
MNENEKGNIIMRFVVIILIYILLVCVHFFFEKCIFVWSYKKKRLLVLMDGYCVRV